MYASSDESEEESDAVCSARCELDQDVVTSEHTGRESTDRVSNRREAEVQQDLLAAKARLLPAGAVAEPTVRAYVPRRKRLLLTGAVAEPTVRAYVPRRKRTGVDSVEKEPTSVASAVKTSDNLLLRDLLHNSGGHTFEPKRVKQSQVATGCSSALTGHTKAVLSLEWHPLNSQLLLSASLDGTVKLWDCSTQKAIACYSCHDKAVRDAEWLSCDKIVSGGYDMNAVVLDAEREEVVCRLPHRGFVTAVKVHPSDRNLLLTGDSTATAKSWDLRTNQVTKHFTGAGGRILDIAVLQSGSEFVASSEIVRKNAASQAMVVWDIASSAVLSNQVYIEPFTCPTLRAHPSTNVFLAQSNGDYVVLFSSRKPYKLNKYKRFEGHTVAGHDVGFDVSSDGTRICSGSSDGKVYFYDFHSSRVLKVVPISCSPNLAVAFHPNVLSTVAVSNWDGNIHILD